ncbi:MAG: sulfonate ABC transporter [Betaproteobacteria bacterium HGW-Betaproteobacteria-22]|nr:MAG: sulfonate ABC transporter [Betaproteobacteria bacterium HGW-Betaproteobacteria-22]
MSSHTQTLKITHDWTWLTRVVATVRKLLGHSGIVVTGFIFPLIVLALWQLAFEQNWLPVQILPPPSLVWQTFWELIDSGDLTVNLWVSLKRIAWSVLIGGSAGLLIGFAIGLSKRAYAYIYPTFDVVSQFPVVGWIPLLMIFLGIDEGLKIAAISLAVVVPVTVSTYKGIRSVPPALFEVGKVYGFSYQQTLLRIALPAALPAIFSGVRQGVMQAWLSLVFVELLASSEGIGYLMVWGRQLLQMDIVFIGIIVIGLVGVVLDFTLRFIESRLQTWRRSAF